MELRSKVRVKPNAFLYPMLRDTIGVIGVIQRITNYHDGSKDIIVAFYNPHLGIYEQHCFNKDEIEIIREEREIRQMEHTEQEIVDALKVLQKTCNYTNCDYCSLRNNESTDSRCYLKTHNPSNYHIVDLPTNKPRRLFND